MGPQLSMRTTALRPYLPDATSCRLPQANTRALEFGTQDPTTGCRTPGDHHHVVEKRKETSTITSRAVRTGCSPWVYVRRVVE